MIYVFNIDFTFVQIYDTNDFIHIDYPFSKDDASGVYLGRWFIKQAKKHDNLLYRLYRLVYGSCP